VLGQLCANIFFPKALIKYMEETELQYLSSEAFILIVNIFDENSVKDATPAFVQKIIDALPYIVDEGTMNALISILVCVCPTFERRNPENNPVTAEFTNEDKEQFYKEKLLFLTNRGSVYRLEKCMETLSVLLQNPKSVEMFNENDVDFIVDVAIRELGVANKVVARVETLKVLNIILDHAPYWQYYSHRLQDIEQLLESQIIFEDEDKSYSEKELVQYAIMNYKLSSRSKQ
jgi:hypothetical protein